MVREIAHRGYADRAPENTVRAARAAAATADAVEVDVRRCADALVTIHDESVDRVTDASGPVGEFGAADLDALSVLGTDAGVPRLADVLAAVPDEVGLVLELKERGLAAETLALAASVENDVTVSSFDPVALREARAAAPAVPRAFLFDESPRDGVRTALELDCEGVHPSAGLCLRSSVVRQARDADLDVTAWTVRSRLVAWLLERRGVDGVIADAPAADRRWL